ncbi:hypothetical protein EDD18DRAFT_1117375 [Armillaria luteobubalina]|uniref:Uncharacterized protein n=1 Tax=Armillaria luteobubalina TaxID=153913 RepID=A0AA39U3E4_9AGAR|nr:hypothetical protein EDD18DRAFT_1117375 [Armillaria luteobubalina]
MSSVGLPPLYASSTTTFILMDESRSVKVSIEDAILHAEDGRRGLGECIAHSKPSVRIHFWISNGILDARASARRRLVSFYRLRQEADSGGTSTIWRDGRTLASRLNRGRWGQFAESRWSFGGMTSFTEGLSECGRALYE